MQCRRHDAGCGVGTVAATAGGKVRIGAAIRSLAGGETERVRRFMDRGLKRRIREIKASTSIGAQLSEPHRNGRGLANLNPAEEILRAKSDGNIDARPHRRPGSAEPDVELPAIKVTPLVPVPGVFAGRCMRGEVSSRDISRSC